MEFSKMIEQAQRLESNIAEADASEFCECGERTTIGYHGVSDKEVRSYWYCSPSCFLKHKEKLDAGATASDASLASTRRFFSKRSSLI